MGNKEENMKTQNEKKHELASAWSFHMLSALNDKLERALKDSTG